MTRIAIVSRSYKDTLGGMEKHTQSLVANLRSRDIEVDVLVPASNGDALGKPFLGDYGERIIYVSRSPNKYLKYSASFWMGISKYISENQYDTVISISIAIAGHVLLKRQVSTRIITIHHGTYLSERRTLLAAFKRNPSLMSLLGIFYTYILEYLQGIAFKSSAYNIAISELVQQSLEKKYKQPCVLIRNGIDTDYFTYSEKKFNGKINILFLARLHKEKGIRVLAESIMLMRRDYENVYEDTSFNIVGDGPEKKWLADYIADNNLTNISYKGAASPETVRDHLNLNQIYVFPTLREEGLPYSLLEAMSCGLVCIVSSYPGAELIIKDAKDGYLIDQPVDKKRLAELIVSIARSDNSANLGRISKSARSTIEKKFDLNKSMNKLMSLILE